MQYKIPVQIENEDTIFLGLSLRQLTIIMVGGGIAYKMFDGLVLHLPKEVAAIPSLLLAGLSILIAVFKKDCMTFIPFILALLRYNINYKERFWIMGVDSFNPLDIGYVSINDKTQEKNIDFTDKIDKIKNIESRLEKI